MHCARAGIHGQCFRPQYLALSWVVEGPGLSSFFLSFFLSTVFAAGHLPVESTGFVRRVVCYENFSEPRNGQR